LITNNLSIDKKWAAISILIFIVIIIMVGIIVNSYTQISVSLDDASFHSIQLRAFSLSTLLSLGLNTLSGSWLGAAFDLIDEINLNLEFGISNNGFLPVYIPDLTYDLSVNGVHVGQGYSEIDTTINPGQTRQVYALQNFQKTGLLPAATSIVENDGIIDLRVSGTAHFELFGLSIPIPFESSKQVSIIDEIRNRLNIEIQS